MTAAEGSVFLVHHVRALADGADDVKLVGVYSTLDRARAAVARLRPQPGFRDAPDGFHVEEYQLDTDHWTEGY